MKKNFLHEYESDGANDSDEINSSNDLVENIVNEDSGLSNKKDDNSIGSIEKILPLASITKPLDSFDSNPLDEHTGISVSNNSNAKDISIKSIGSVDVVDDKINASNKSDMHKNRNYRSHTHKSVEPAKLSESPKKESKSHDKNSHMSSHSHKSRHRSRSRSHEKRRHKDTRERSPKRSRNSPDHKHHQDRIKASKRYDEPEKKHNHRSRSRDHKSSSHSSRNKPSSHREGTSHSKNNKRDKNSAKSQQPCKSNDPMESPDFQMDTVRKAMEYAVEKASETTGITLPKYYNPATVNPMKYAQQMQKRKLLWTGASKKKSAEPEDTSKVPVEAEISACLKPANVIQPAIVKEPKAQATPATTLNATELYWQNTAFAESEQTEKFRKLMGIKKVKEPSAVSNTEAAPTLTEEEKRKRQEYFEKLDRQYEIARMSTHTMRGVGLGYASNSLFDSNFLGKM